MKAKAEVYLLSNMSEFDQSYQKTLNSLLKPIGSEKQVHPREIFDR